MLTTNRMMSAVTNTALVWTQAKKVAATPAPAAATPATPAAISTAATPGAPQPSTGSAVTPAAAAPASNASSPSEFPSEVVQNLKALGFPESEVLVCLR